MKKERIIELAKNAQRTIEHTLECNIDAQLIFYTVKSAPKIAKELRNRIVPNEWEEKFGTEEYYASIAGEAVVGTDESAILIRTDTNYDEWQLFHIILHEYSHVFLIRNEYEGTKFFNKNIHNAEIISGYSIWREYAAEILARSMDQACNCFDLKHESGFVRESLVMIGKGCSAEIRRDIMTDILVKVMFSEAFCTSKEWAVFERLCSQYFPMDILGNIMMIVYHQMKREDVPFWEINKDFIAELGSAFMLTCARVKMLAMESID